MSVWENIKTGVLYEVVNDNVTNRTNANDGQKMILYKDVKGNPYVREEKEFHEKFKPAKEHTMYLAQAMNEGATKMALIVRTDIKMPVGKTSSQTAHAALGAILNKAVWEGDDKIVISNISAAERAWLLYKFTKIVLGCGDVNDFNAMRDQAILMGINVKEITDAGDTVFGGVPTVTCMAIGPDWPDRINGITGHLKPLR